jgi:hypothetical protein
MAPPLLLHRCRSGAGNDRAPADAPSRPLRERPARRGRPMPPRRRMCVAGDDRAGRADALIEERRAGRGHLEVRIDPAGRVAGGEPAEQAVPAAAVAGHRAAQEPHPRHGQHRRAAAGGRRPRGARSLGGRPADRQAQRRGDRHAGRARQRLRDAGGIARRLQARARRARTREEGHHAARVAAPLADLGSGPGDARLEAGPHRRGIGVRRQRTQRPAPKATRLRQPHRRARRTAVATDPAGNLVGVAGPR